MDPTILIVLVAAVFVVVVFPMTIYKHLREPNSAERTDASRRSRQQASADEVRAAALRREVARADCELLYRTHAPEIGQRFTKEAFDEFMYRHLSESSPPEHVESRAAQLRTMIEAHCTKADPPKKRWTLAELARWYLVQRQQIEAISLSKEDQDAVLSQLEERYLRLQEKHLRGLEP